MKRAQGHGVMRAREFRPKGDGGIGCRIPFEPNTREG